MKFYARTDTAVRALLFLSQENTSCASCETIARAIGAYDFEVSDILPTLLEFGFVRVDRDSYYSLSVHPSQIHLYDIVRAMQGDIALLSCLAPDHFCACEAQNRCSFRFCCIELQDQIRSFLRNKTLLDLRDHYPCSSTESD